MTDKFRRVPGQTRPYTAQLRRAGKLMTDKSVRHFTQGHSALPQGAQTSTALRQKLITEVPFVRMGFYAASWYAL